MSRRNAIADLSCPSESRGDREPLRSGERAPRPSGWAWRLALASLLLASGCTNTTPAALAPAAPVAASNAFPLQATVDLGVIYQGQTATLNAWLKNEGSRDVRVARMESSCECLTVRLSQMEVPPGKRVLATLHYDGAKEPEFVGSLLIEVQLTDDQGKQQGEIRVPVEVIRGDT